jgi:hypothetical protein
MHLVLSRLITAENVSEKRQNGEGACKARMHGLQACQAFARQLFVL